MVLLLFRCQLLFVFVMEVDRTLYISNLPPKATDLLIYELFHQAGPVESVSLKNGYGFVTFEDEESVLYACSLFEGVRLYNYELKIKPRQGSKFANCPIKSYPPYTNVPETSTNTSVDFREYNHGSYNRRLNRSYDYTPAPYESPTPVLCASRSYGRRGDMYPPGRFSLPGSSFRDRSPLLRNPYNNGRGVHTMSRHNRAYYY